jgi:hypothetical protein
MLLVGSISEIMNCARSRRAEEECEEGAGEPVRVEAGEAPEDEKDTSEGDLMAELSLVVDKDEESMMKRSRLWTGGFETRGQNRGLLLAKGIKDEQTDVYSRYAHRTIQFEQESDSGTRS